MGSSWVGGVTLALVMALCLGDDLSEAAVERHVVGARAGRVPARPGLVLADGRGEGREAPLGDLALDHADQLVVFADGPVRTPCRVLCHLPQPPSKVS